MNEPARGAPAASACSSRALKPKKDRDAWLLVRVHADRYVDVLNRQFVEDYIEFSGATCRLMWWGAPKCALLSADLARLAREKVLTRQPYGLPTPNWQPGFPKWVYSYSVSHVGEMRLREMMQNTPVLAAHAECSSAAPVCRAVADR